MFGWGSNKAGSKDGRGSVDDELKSAFNTSVAATAPVINGYKGYSDGEVSKIEAGLKERQEFSKRFQKVLALVGKWQDLDVADTTALTKYRESTAKNAYQRLTVVAKGRAQQDYLQASFAHQMKALKESNATRIGELHQRKAQLLENTKGSDNG